MHILKSKTSHLTKNIDMSQYKLASQTTYIKSDIDESRSMIFSGFCVN